MQKCTRNMVGGGGERRKPDIEISNSIGGGWTQCACGYLQVGRVQKGRCAPFMCSIKASYDFGRLNKS